MPYYLIHAGTKLQKVTTAGVLSDLTLPGGVTIVNTRPARFAILDRYVVVVNAVSVNLKIDAETLGVSVLSIPGPSAAPTVAAGAAGVPDGEYRYRVSFAIKSAGIVTTESPFSVNSAPITLALQQGSLSNIPVSVTSGVNCRRIYRTLSGGAEFYLVGDIDNNTATTYTDNTSDFDLGQLPVVDDLGNPPGTDASDRFRLIIAWKDRLFAAPYNEPDLVYYSGNRKPWGWHPENLLTVKPVGQDTIGVTAFLARRDELIMGKKRSLWKLIGETPSEYRMVQIAEGIGIESQDAALVVRDRCYFLSAEGFYEYGPEGLLSLSRDLTHPWFSTDTYFNRSRFDEAFATWNPKYDLIELHLAAAGSSAIDRWVTFDLRRRIWLGPHRTGAFTPTMAGLIQDANELDVPIMGSSVGHLYTENSATYTDDGTAIDFDVYTLFHSNNTPDIEKYWGELAMISRIEAAGTLTITPTVGALNATPGTAISHALTSGRQRLRRLGTGRFCQLRFQNAENNQGTELYGYEIPYHELGRR